MQRPRYIIFAKWITGYVEEVDTAEDKDEARYLVREYKLAYGEHAVDVWKQRVVSTQQSEVQT